MTNTKNLVKQTLDMEVQRCLQEDIREKKVAASGMWGAVRAKSSRKRMDFNGTKSQRNPSPMIVTYADGSQEVIDSSCMTASGRLKKSYCK